MADEDVHEFVSVATTLQQLAEDAASKCADMRKRVASSRQVLTQVLLKKPGACFFHAPFYIYLQTRSGTRSVTPRDIPLLLQQRDLDSLDKLFRGDPLRHVTVTKHKPRKLVVTNLPPSLAEVTNDLVMCRDMIASMQDQVKQVKADLKKRLSVVKERAQERVLQISDGNDVVRIVMQGDDNQMRAFYLYIGEETGPLHVPLKRVKEVLAGSADAEEGLKQVFERETRYELKLAKGPVLRAV